MRTAADWTVAVPSAPVRVVVQAEKVPLSKPSLKSGPPAGGAAAVVNVHVRGLVMALPAASRTPLTRPVYVVPAARGAAGVRIAVRNGAE